MYGCSPFWNQHGMSVIDPSGTIFERGGMYACTHARTRDARVHRIAHVQAPACKMLYNM